MVIGLVEEKMMATVRPYLDGSEPASGPYDASHHREATRVLVGGILCALASGGLFFFFLSVNNVYFMLASIVWFVFGVKDVVQFLISLFPRRH